MFSIPVFTWHRWWEIFFFILLGIVLIAFYSVYFGILKIFNTAKSVYEFFCPGN